MNLKDLIKDYKVGTYQRFNVEVRDEENWFLKEVSVTDHKKLYCEDFCNKPIKEWFIERADTVLRIVILI